MTKTTFKGEKDGENLYEFHCEGCGAEGEIGVPVKMHGSFGCLEGCGATYIQWKGQQAQ